MFIASNKPNASASGGVELTYEYFEKPNNNSPEESLKHMPRKYEILS